jgi:hypothetical protein
MMRCALAAFAVALSAAATPLRAQPLEDVTMAVGGGFRSLLAMSPTGSTPTPM